MKILETTTKGEYGNDYSIEVELITSSCKKSVSFGEGEPEDMSLSRDLNDAYSISKLLIEAYEAGKRGESFEIKYIEYEEED